MVVAGDQSVTPDGRAWFKWAEKSVPREPNVQRLLIGRLPVANVSRQSLSEVMARDCFERRQQDIPPLLCFSANAQSVSMNSSHADFSTLMSHADLIHADGMPVVWASRLVKGACLPERVATTDWFHDAANLAEKIGLKFYFLGARLARLERALERIRSQHPDLKIAGFCDGYFEAMSKEEVFADIQKKRPDVLWLGLGRPYQERFAIENQNALHGVGWVKTCGGLIDHLSGDIPRAPKMLQKMGLEWSFRLAQEPTRLLARYALTNPHAFWVLMTRTRRDPLPTAATFDRAA